MDKSRDVEKEIVEAARRVFHSKGFKEATMRDIAAEANINLAMLHYYFRSKDNLFLIVFDESFRRLYEKIAKSISDPEWSVFDKIRMITNEYLSFFQNEPSLPPFIIGEVIRNPEKIGKRLRQIVDPQNTFKAFAEQLQKECMEGKIRPVSAFTLLLNTLSLCVFPAISKSVMQELLEYDEITMKKLLDDRKKEVAEFIINAIKI